jgi:hypothetical protein
MTAAHPPADPMAPAHGRVISCPNCHGTGHVMAPPFASDRWVAVWWTMWDGERVKAIAGPLSRTGKTVKVRYYITGQGQIERNVSPKSVEPR